MIGWSLGVHQEFLISKMRRGRSLRDKCQLEVGDDTIDHLIVGEEGDDAHFPLAFGTGQGINLVDLSQIDGLRIQRSEVQIPPGPTPFSQENQQFRGNLNSTGFLYFPLFSTLIWNKIDTP